MFLTKTTAAQNEDAPSYHRVRGLYFLTVIFAATIWKIVFMPQQDIECRLRRMYSIPGISGISYQCLYSHNRES